MRFRHCRRADRGYRCKRIHHYWHSEYGKHEDYGARSDLEVENECKRCQKNWGIRQMFEGDYPSWTHKSAREEVQGDWGLRQMFEDDYPEWARKSAQQEADNETGCEVWDGFIDEILYDGEGGGLSRNRRRFRRQR